MLRRSSCPAIRYECQIFALDHPVLTKLLRRQTLLFDEMAHSSSAHAEFTRSVRYGEQVTYVHAPSIAGKECFGR